MCGIIYAKNKKNNSVVEKIWQAYINQKHRGEQGFGFLAITNKKVRLYRAQYDDGIRKHLKSLKNTSEILFHHRYPTSTPNLLESTHPIKVENDKLDYNYYVIHNGIITNDDDLYEKHNKMGFKYNTKIITRQITTNEVYETYCYNDSECLAIELALYFEGKKDSIDSAGSIAFMCIQTDKNDKPISFYYGRNAGSPLKVDDKKNILTISSESDDLKIDDITTNVIFKKDYTSNKEMQIYTNVGKYNLPRYSVDKNVDYTGGMGFNSVDDFYKDTEIYEIDEYYELLQEEIDLRKELQGYKKIKDVEMIADTEYQLFYISESIKDYEKRYNF